MNTINQSIKSVFFGMLASLVLVFAVFSGAQIASAQAVPSATIITTAMVCDREADLPNWGAGGDTINATTAADWIAQSNGRCQLSEGWSLQWMTDDNSTNPGDNKIGEAGLPWQTMGTTDSDGQFTAEVPVDKWLKIWVRQVNQADYIEFSSDNTEPVDEDFSAEMYCHDDVLYFDNIEYILPFVEGETFYCVAFNVSKDSSNLVADDQNLTTEEDTALDVFLTGSDSLNPGDTLTFNIVSGPTNGTLGDLVDNAVTYTPNPNYFGTDSFVFEVCNEDGECFPGDINIEVLKLNDDAPVITLNGPTTVDVTTGGTYTEQGASCDDNEDGAITVVITGTVDVNTAGAYTLTYTCTDSDSNTDEEIRTVNVANPSNGGGGGGGGGSSGGSSSTTSSGSIPTVALATPVGQVLGAETGCGIYMTKFVRMGYTNDAEEVKKLQIFLNQEMNAGLPVTGFFGPLTDKAVRDFQVKYADDILKPWNINGSTGLVYQTTITKINNIKCPSLNIPIPTNLVDWVNNPDTVKTRV